MSWDAKAKTLRIERPLNAEQETTLLAVFSDAKSKSIIAEACSQRAGRKPALPAREKSPSQLGLVFEIPVLAVKQGEFYRQFDGDDLEENMAWSLSEANAELPGFLIPTEQRGIKIDITDDEKLQQDFIPLNDAQQQLPVGLLAGSFVCPPGFDRSRDRNFFHARHRQAD